MNGRTFGFGIAALLTSLSADLLTFMAVCIVLSIIAAIKVYNQ